MSSRRQGEKGRFSESNSSSQIEEQEPTSSNFNSLGRREGWDFGDRGPRDRSRVMRCWTCSEIGHRQATCPLNSNYNNQYHHNYNYNHNNNNYNNKNYNNNWNNRKNLRYNRSNTRGRGYNRPFRSENAHNTRQDAPKLKYNTFNTRNNLN